MFLGHSLLLIVLQKHTKNLPSNDTKHIWQLGVLNSSIFVLQFVVATNREDWLKSPCIVSLVVGKNWRFKIYHLLGKNYFPNIEEIFIYKKKYLKC